MYTKRQNYINKRLSEIKSGLRYSELQTGTESKIINAVLNNCKPTNRIPAVNAIHNYKQKTERNRIPAVLNNINYFFCIRFLQGHRILVKICSGAVIYAIRFDVQGSTYAPELKSVARAIVYISRGLLPPRNASALFWSWVGSP